MLNCYLILILLSNCNCSAKRKIEVLVTLRKPQEWKYYLYLDVWLFLFFVCFQVKDVLFERNVKDITSFLLYCIDSVPEGLFKLWKGLLLEIRRRMVDLITYSIKKITDFSVRKIRTVFPFILMISKMFLKIICLYFKLAE